MDGILILLCHFSFIHFLCTATDFSAGALPIGMKVCTAVRPSSGLLPFWRDRPRDGRIMGVNRGPYGGMCFLLKHLLSTHADRHVVDISVTVCLFFCFFVRRIFVTDMSGVGRRRVMKFCRMAELGG